MKAITEVVAANLKKPWPALIATIFAALIGYNMFTHRAAGPGAIDARKLWDGRSSVRFRALATPEMVPASKADFMLPGDYVLGVTIAGHSRAYPSTYIGFHHVVNDKVFTASNEAAWFAVTYCDMCGTGIVFDTMLDGKARELEFYGLYNGTIALCDRETQSVFLPAVGSFATGALKDKTLKSGNLLDTTWAAWKRLHPDTLVMVPDAADKEYYADNAKHVRSMDAFPMEFFAPTVTRTDHRMQPFERIVGVTVHGTDAKGAPAVLRRAYTLKSLKESGGVLEDMIGGVRVVLFFDSDNVAVSAVSPSLDGAVHHFKAVKAGPQASSFRDNETGTYWTIEGRASSGPLAGRSLTRIDSTLGEWYSWAAFFPETTIYGSAEPARSAQPVR